MQSKKKEDISRIKNIFIPGIIGNANSAKLEADSIKYVTCLKLKYPPKNFFFPFYIIRDFEYSHINTP